MAGDKAETDLVDNLHSLRSEELAAQKTAMIGRTIALAFIALLVTVLSPWPAPLFTYLLLLTFVGLGWTAWHVARSEWGRPWHQYLFVFADFALLSFTLVYPNPLVPFDYAPQFSLRYGSFIYFFVLLAGLAYVYQPKLVLWGGLSGAICWAVGVGWLFNLPDTIYQHSGEYTFDTAMALVSEPTFIDLGERAQEIAVLLIVACLLALAVRRSRRIAQRQATLARERENLARYFPRKTAQMLAERTDPFSRPSEQNAAVVFADLVAFTTWSEKHSPGETIELLRDVHGLLADIVFRHNGTLDKFIGDGLMATFGTPEPSGRDASNALAAITEMVKAFERWKESDAPEQARDLDLAIGAHYGPVVVGNVGSKTRLEFSVLGDTVNVASRLEGATRKVGCRLLASSALIAAAAAENERENKDVLSVLGHVGQIKLRGRSQEIDVYRL
ncbi:adenylate/guanylate cyclase domain-containing protein [Roseibium sp.]|uniref:adenylate/guanylate cyclase domain-containing protein n=1 Tax=Roseibium sp. TaxID=1936156 RepID=UPI003BAF7C97